MSQCGLEVTRSQERVQGDAMRHAATRTGMPTPEGGTAAPSRMMSCRRLVVLGLPEVLGLSGCETLPGIRHWGEDATLTPGWACVGRAAQNAALAPETWIPAAGALAFQIGDADQEVVEWAAENTPIFGSQRNADRMSDHLKSAAAALWIASAVATPSGDEPGEWVLNKARGFGVQIASGFLQREAVAGLKRATNRTRPNGGGESFPSAHAASTTHYNALTRKNIEALAWPAPASAATRIGLGTLSVATAWARVEANQHYPSDVLAGMAIGHFFGVFFTDAFLGLDEPQNVVVRLQPAREGVVVAVRVVH